MSEKIFNQVICLKETTSEKEYKEINKLEEIISLKDKVNLKLELDYRLKILKHSGNVLKNINEFLYYIDDSLVAYLGISCFGGNIAEINGMTHPDWRRKGIFKKLFELAMNECSKRKFDQILLLTDGKSESGIEFIKAVGGEYEVSEYGMETSNKTYFENISLIKLRKAEMSDKKEIGRQDAIFFYDKKESENLLDEVEIRDDAEVRIETSYMIELNNIAIGKINIKYNDNSAFISGFGILPEFRGKGYGKIALKESLKLINEKNINQVGLDVSCKNDTALNLYKSCGFEEKSVMNYYKYDI
jgi:ribosomal protein S18 acetylase RimI-like enzyme